MLEILNFLRAHWSLSLTMLVSGVAWFFLLLLDRKNKHALTPLEAVLLINHGKATVLYFTDTPNAEECSIPNARSISLNKLEKEIHSVAKKKTQPLVCISKPYKISKQAATILRGEGYTDAYFVEGGLAAWRNAGL